MRVGSVMVLALVLAACSGDDESGGAADEPADAGAELRGDLTVWIMDPDNPEARVTIDATGAAFEAEHEGVTIDVEYVPRPDAYDRFVTGIAGGQVPDLAEMGTSWTPVFAEQGAFASVELPEGVDYVDSLVESGTVDGANHATRGTREPGQ